MASLHPYTFNGSTRFRSDNTDKSQSTIQNTRFGDYQLSNYFSDARSNDHVLFATSQPAMMFGSTFGASNGIGANTVEVDSMLNVKKENARSLEKLSLQQRPFLTVPYLGRGSCDTALESQLKQGDIITNKKSVSTISEQSYSNLHMYPLIDSIKDTVTNPKYLVQEAALDGWTRGGASARAYSKAADQKLPGSGAY